MPDPDLTDIPEHKMTLSMTMPSEDTAYFCSFHRGPQLNNKTHHIIAFDAVLPDEKSLAHTHHFILYNCYKDPSSNVSLEEIMGNKTVEHWNGDYCYRPSDPDMPKPPMKYCKEYLYVWAKGGKKMSFPDNVGYPIGNKNQADGDQFYMLEVHYDNPGKLENVHFETGVKFYYTENLRDEEAGLLMVGHDVSPALLIPPNTTEFVTAGHCGSLCTNSSFPASGLKVFNVLLHSHLSGRKLKLRHFRGEEELPWLDFDNQYDFDYQQNKHLNKEVAILPGDHFTFECTYSTMWKKGRVVIGDLSSEDEMCQAFMWHYPRIDRDLCGSTYDLEHSLEDLGITNFTILETIGNPKIWINQPAELAGDFEDSLSTKYVWTENFKKELEETRRYKIHDGFCQSKVSKQNSLPNFPVEYPKIRQEYQPQDVCKTDNSSGNVLVSFGVITLSFLSLAQYLISY